MHFLKIVIHGNFQLDLLIFFSAIFMCEFAWKVFSLYLFYFICTWFTQELWIDFLYGVLCSLQCYFSYIVATTAPIHVFLEFFLPGFYTIFFPSQWLLSHNTIVKTTDSGEKGINPVTMTIIDILREYWSSPGIEPPTSCFQVLYATNWAMGLGWMTLRKSILKIMWEKERILITSIFSFIL